MTAITNNKHFTFPLRQCLRPNASGSALLWNPEVEGPGAEEGGGALPHLLLRSPAANSAEARRKRNGRSAMCLCVSRCQKRLLRGSVSLPHRVRPPAALPFYPILPSGTPRDALQGKGPQRRPQERLDRRLEEVAEAVGGGYCRLQVPLRLVLAVRETVAGHKGGGVYVPPFQCIPGGTRAGSVYGKARLLRAHRRAPATRLLTLPPFPPDPPPFSRCSRWDTEMPPFAQPLPPLCLGQRESNSLPRSRLQRTKIGPTCQ